MTWAIAWVSCTFFLWGLSYGLLDVLNQHFQQAMHINKAESGLLQLAYFLAYFVIAIPAALFNQRFGYPRGLIVGLALFALGALLFIPALAINSFTCFVGSLFVLACGSGFLETTANPYIAQLGVSDTAGKRINFAQACCGLGTVVGPLIGGALFFRPTEEPAARSNDLVVGVYAGIAVLVLLLVMAIARTAMPNIGQAGKGARAYRTLLAHQRYLAGVLAQFLYVAAQVGVGAFFINYVIEAAVDINSQSAAWLLSAAMLLFMLGRFIGTFCLGFISSSKLLAICALSNILLSVAVVGLTGYLAVAALCLIYFFMSIMFPTIFSLALRELGDQTKIASSLLAMAVSGGAVFPYPMGTIADHFGTATAYVLPLLSFVMIYAYAHTLMREDAVTQAAHCA